MANWMDGVVRDERKAMTAWIGDVVLGVMVHSLRWGHNFGQNYVQCQFEFEVSVGFPWGEGQQEDPAGQSS